MKAKRGAVYIGVLLAAAATLLLVILPKSGNLYVGYAFCLVGIVMMEAGYLLAECEHVPASLALMRIYRRFLPLTLLISLPVLVLEWTSVFCIPAWLHLLVQLFVLLWQSITLTRLRAGGMYIDKVNARTEQASQWKMLTAHVRKLAENAKAPEAKQELKKLEDVLRCSDPVSTAASHEADKKIEAFIYALGAYEDESLSVRCDEIAALVRKRNDLVKASK